MLALALTITLTQPQEAPRLRTICKNGTVVLAEKMASEETISVQLWASAYSVPETKKTHGLRHLLEHLAAKGSGDLDSRLERQGCYLRARTFRDAMQIELNVGPRQLDVGIAALLEVIRPLQVDQAAIDRELRVMKQEFAIYDDASRLSAGAWRQAFGDEGLDPFGNLETMASATVDELRELHRRHFYPENLVVCISGPIDIESATQKAIEAFGVKQGGIRIARGPGVAGKPGRIEVEGFGEGRAAICPGYDNPKTIGALAFALAVASEVEGSFVTYTPSTDRGVVTLGQTERASGMGLKIDGYSTSDLPRLFSVGKVLARRWVERYLRTTSGSAYIRGTLLCQNPAASPESMISAIDALSFEQFKDAPTYFSKDKGITVVGL